MSGADDLEEVPRDQEADGLRSNHCNLREHRGPGERGHLVPASQCLVVGHPADGVGRECHAEPFARWRDPRDRPQSGVRAHAAAGQSRARDARQSANGDPAVGHLQEVPFRPPPISRVSPTQRRHTGWAKKAGPQTLDHSSVKS